MTTLTPEQENAVLCYVEEPWAYFTTLPLSQQWGDDWNDAPYEHNAGRPYEWHEGNKKPKWSVFKLAYDGDFETPRSGCLNSIFGVEQINAGWVAWLRGRAKDGKPLAILAGTPMGEFVRIVQSSGGWVYVPMAGEVKP